MVYEACVSIKIFVGHVSYLKDKCDYIFLPRINSLKKGQKVCNNFIALYDLCKNLFPDIKFITYNVDVDNKIKESDAFFKMGKKLGFKKKDIKGAYYFARKRSNIYYNKKRKAFEKLTKMPVIVDENGHLMGALGSAILAKRSKKEIEFNFNITDISFETKGTTCLKCPNNCEIISVKKGNKLIDSWGGICERGKKLKNYKTL